MIRELVLGCGHSRRKVISQPGEDEYKNPLYLDIDPKVSPDVVWDLNAFPYPFSNEEFDEIHAYEVLEHVGKQGDWRFFFEQFNEFYRILKEDGIIYISVPHPTSPWAWGDPGHTRVLPKEVFYFLDQEVIDKNREKNTAMTDYSEVNFCKFKVIFLKEDVCTYIALQKLV